MNERQKFLIPALLIIPLIVLIISLKRSESGRVVNIYLSPLFSYPQKVITQAFSKGERLAKFFRRKSEVAVENRLLKKSLVEMTAELRELKEYKSENRQLRELLQFRQRLPLGKIIETAIGSEIIGRDPTSWYRTVLIDKGSREGVRQNAPVLTHQGLVGKVKKVGSTESVVLLILDRNSSISALIQRTREQGIVRGGFKNTCRMEYLSAGVEVKYGDVVLSSGLGGIYPKDLVIGTVIGIEKTHSGLLQSAVILPAVEFSRLDNVLIIQR